MNLLAIETSTDAGSIALLHGDTMLARACPAGETHSRTLLPLIHATMAEVGLTYADLQGIAFGAGPGAFTGLRVACAVAQGLAFPHNLPLMPVDTLAAMAWASGGERVIVALDARMGEVYFACFENGTRHGEEGVYSPESVPQPQEIASGNWLACGNGLAAYPALRERLAPYVENWLSDLMPNAEAVAQLAMSRLARGERNPWCDAADAAPRYVRDKVAQTVAERLAQGGKA